MLTKREPFGFVSRLIGFIQFAFLHPLRTYHFRKLCKKMYTALCCCYFFFFFLICRNIFRSQLNFSNCQSRNTSISASVFLHILHDIFYELKCGISIFKVCFLKEKKSSPSLIIGRFNTVYFVDRYN